MGNNKHGEPIPPTITLTSHSGNPSDPTFSHETTTTGRRPTGAFTNGDEIDTAPHPSILSAQSPVHFLLGNFFAMPLISLIIFIIFITVTWFTVLQDARSVNDRILSNATGEPVFTPSSERASLITFAELGVDTRSWPSTGSRYKRIVRFLESRHLRCERHSEGSVLGCSHLRPVRAVRQST